MRDFGTLSNLKRTLLRNRFVSFFRESKFKAAVVGVFGLLFWAGLFGLFWGGLKFLNQFPVVQDPLVQVVMNLLFLSLVLMLTFSNGIIAYVSLFDSDETRFMVAAPLSRGSIYLYKLTETIAFSSWAFLFLATPLVVAYGLFSGSPLTYYLLSPLSIGFLILLPAAAGSIGALLIARFTPSRKGLILVLLLVVGLAILGTGVWMLFSMSPPEGQFDQEWLSGVLSNLQFARHPLLPSRWAAESMILFGRGNVTGGLFYSGILLANGLMGIMGGYYVCELLLTDAWMKTRDHGGGRERKGGRFLNSFSRYVTWPFPDEISLYMRKDLLSFLRDPAQWSQMLIFFGLLGVYFFNLRSLNYHVREEWWRLIISFLNLGATGLTLASFTSRFIYPQFSLEGRRFWVVGMAPIPRRTLVVAKFVFSTVFTAVISIPLILLSVYMLNLRGVYMLLKIGSVFAMCLGLSGLAVGIGAMYPDMTRDDPSKIVSGFGGTLNLVMSLLFVLLMLVIGGVPVYMQKMGEAAGGSGITAGMASFFLVLGLVVLFLFTVLPLYLGVRAARRIEV